LGIGGDAASQRSRLADVEHLAVARDHAIDPGLAWQSAHELGDDSHAIGQRTFSQRVLARVHVDVGLVAHRVLRSADVARKVGTTCGEVCEQASRPPTVATASLYLLNIGTVSADRNLEPNWLPHLAYLYWGRPAHRAGGGKCSGSDPFVCRVPMCG